MGKLISKFVFMPPKRNIIHSEQDITLTTSRNNQIQVKTIERFAKYNLLISHGNAEDIQMTYDWAENVLVKYVNVNVIIYGKLYII